MARPTQWRRTTFVQDTLNYFGHVPSIAVEPGETVIRTFWSLSAWIVYGDTANYPAGTSLLRAGILFDTFVDPTFDTPVSQPDSEWMDLTSCPWHTQLAVSAEVDWLVTANTGYTDRDARAKRLNDTDVPYTVYVSWELATSSLQAVGFNFYVSGSCDMLVALP